MDESYGKTLWLQLGAAIDSLEGNIRECPDSHWGDRSVGRRRHASRLAPSLGERPRSSMGTRLRQVLRKGGMVRRLSEAYFARTSFRDVSASPASSRAM
jgi:hypothetical protein